MFRDHFPHIVSSRIEGPPRNEERLGYSIEGREILAYRFGEGPRKVSLIAGCHADEPVGPYLLRHLVAYLESLNQSVGILKDFSWWIVPDVNPDGAFRNRAWQDMLGVHFEVPQYLSHVVREPPGEDIEFGFPRNENDTEARPENLAIARWWSGTYDLHCSLHGMAFAGGPWFLIDENWVARADSLMNTCRKAVHEMGYSLHDIQRNGEKGFNRIAPGFCTRPNSTAMSSYFIGLGDTDTAKLFRPSSMEYIRSLGGDPLTLVSEMPLFIVPGMGKEIVAADPVAESWNAKIAAWKSGNLSLGEIEPVLENFGVRPMPLVDQIKLQWEFICSGIDLIVN
jgi:hypothetical protein